MTDVLGWRRKFGVLGPSTNTIVQPDFDEMRPRGVTNHYSRIFTPNANAVSNESFRAGAEVIAGNVLEAVRSVMAGRPGPPRGGGSSKINAPGMRGTALARGEIRALSGATPNNARP